MTTAAATATTLKLHTDANATLTKAQKRAQALTDYRTADDAAKITSANKNALKDAALGLCDDLKTYKDTNGKSYSIDKETESTGYSDTIKWALATTNPLNLDAKQIKDLKAKLASTVSTKKNSAPIKRVD